MAREAGEGRLGVALWGLILLLLFLSTSITIR
jgi:hypothetical protein